MSIAQVNVQHNPPEYVLVEERYDDYRAGYDAPYYVTCDAISGRTLWTTYGLTEASCVAAALAAYPEAKLVAVSRYVEKGERA